LCIKSQGDQVLVLDNLSVGSAAELAETCGEIQFVDSAEDAYQLGLIQGDICDLGAVERATVGIDVVVHLAANTGVGPSVEDPFQDCVTNVMGTLNVLEASRQNGVDRLVFASSGAPLGEQIPPLHEGLAPRPASPYGASKLSGEGYCSAYFQSFDLDTVALRFGNVYGPLSNNKSSVVAKFVRQALLGEQWEIYGDGTQTRDYVFIDDLIDAIVDAASVKDVGGEVFQIATSKETTLLELTELLRGSLRTAGIEVADPFHTPSRVGDVQRNYSDTSKALHRLGWSSKVDLQTGLDRTVQSFVNPRDQVPAP